MRKTVEQSRTFISCQSTASQPTDPANWPRHFRVKKRKKNKTKKERRKGIGHSLLESSDHSCAMPLRPLLVVLIPLLTNSFFSDNLLAKFWPWMCSLSFIFLFWFDRLFFTGAHLHQKAVDAFLKHFVGSMISWVKVLLDCSSTIACLIFLWSHACSWSHLLARSLCHPLFHLINLLLEAITPCLLASFLNHLCLGGLLIFIAQLLVHLLVH